MAEQKHVDWDGLVYYDSKIKQYIANEAENYFKMGGEVTFNQLPSPSFENLNYLYKVIDEFVSNEYFVKQDYIYPANTWVQVSDQDGIYLFTIFNEPGQGGGSGDGESTDLSPVYDRIRDIEKSVDEIDDTVKTLEKQVERIDNSNICTIKAPTEVTVGNLQSGSSIYGKTLNEILRMIFYTPIKVDTFEPPITTQTINGMTQPYVGINGQDGYTTTDEFTLIEEDYGDQSDPTLMGVYQVSKNGEVIEEGYQIPTTSGRTTQATIAMPQNVVISQVFIWEPLNQTWSEYNGTFEPCDTIQGTDADGNTVYYTVYSNSHSVSGTQYFRFVYKSI